LKLKQVKRYFAPASVIVLVMTAAFAFLSFQGTYSGPPPVLDPNFNLWVNAGNGSQLMVWNLELVKGVSDQFSINKTMLQGKKAVELSLYQSGIQSRWVYASLSQTLDGGRLTQLLNATVGFWVWKEPCLCDSDPFNKTSRIVAVETNDGVHTISFVFSDGLQGVKTLLDHRIVFMPTPSRSWYFEKLNIAQEYRTMHWRTPERLTFSIVFGVAGGAVGWQSAYLAEIALSRDGLHFPISPENELALTVSIIRLRLNP
jgi:hypothetical protein